MTTFQQWTIDMIMAGCSQAEIDHIFDNGAQKARRCGTSLMTVLDECLKMKQTGTPDQDIYHFLAL